jgi:hypothetical protein
MLQKFFNPTFAHDLSGASHEKQVLEVAMDIFAWQKKCLGFSPGWGWLVSGWFGPRFFSKFDRAHRSALGGPIGSVRVS